MSQRSPLIFWLLLAATISVDAVAFTWAEAAHVHADHGFIAFEALLLSQISVVCIWSSLNSEKSIWTRLSPFLAVVLTSLIWGLFSEAHFVGKVGEGWTRRVIVQLVNQGLHAALLLAMLWLLKRTALWKRRVDRAAGWQFSITDLLTVMTVVAALGVGMRFTGVYDDLDWLGWAEIVFLCGSAVLATSAVLIWTLWQTPWVLRASGVFAVAIGLAALVLLAEPRPPGSWIGVAANFLIQAPVLIAWLAWAPLLPQAHLATSS
jgi:hypothetical protein